VPSDPLCLEPKAAVNNALFSITPVKLSPRDLLLQKPGWNLSRVLRDTCSERYRTLAQICISRLEVQRSMARVPELHANILQFCSDLSVPIETKEDQVAGKWCESKWTS